MYQLSKKYLADNFAIYGGGREHFRPPNYPDILTDFTTSWSLTKSGWCGSSLEVWKSHHAVAAFRITDQYQ